MAHLETTVRVSSDEVLRMNVRLQGGFVRKLCMRSRGHLTSLMSKSGMFYEHRMLQHVVNLSVRGAYVDAGAHIGTHTVVFAEACPSTRVLAIEPINENLLYLTENVADLAQVLVLKAAVDEVVQVIRLPRAPFAGDTDRKRLRSCPTITLDDCIAEHLGEERVGLIKIDVAPHMNMRALRGGLKTVKRDRPVLCMETTTDDDRKQLERLKQSLEYVAIRHYGRIPTYLLVPKEHEAKLRKRVDAPAKRSGRK
jgi:FkbM family methyltransferase